MSIDFTPKQNEYKGLESFRFWCQHVLPLAYDDSLSYYELLCKVVNYLNDVIENTGLMGEDVTHMFETYKVLLDWVNSYFDNLEVQNEINTKLDGLIADGTFASVIEPLLSEYANEVATANVKYRDLQGQVNNLVLTQGNPESSSAEIAQARSTFATLNDRMGVFMQAFSHSVITDNTLLSDANEAIPNRMYTINTNSGILNLPSNIDLTLVTFGTALNSEFKINGQMQMAITRTNDVYCRMGWSGEYSTWKRLADADITTPSDYVISNYNLPVLNDTSIVDDCNTMSPNTVWIILSTAEIANKPSSENMVILNYGGSPKSAEYEHAGQVQIAVTFSGKMFVRMWWSTGAIGTAWSEIARVSDISEKNPLLPIDDSYLGLSNFTAIGDSITVSISYPNGNGVNVESWASILARKMGRTTKIYAQGGRTTGDFIASTDYSDAMSQTNQFAILFLGINDVNRSVELGSANDIGTGNGTFYANYSKIISDLLVNHKFVFCLNIPTRLQGNSRRIDFNVAIDNICKTFDKAFVCDIEKYNDIISVYGGGHLSSVGYGALSKCVASAICDTMRSNIYFKEQIDSDTYGV